MVKFTNPPLLFCRFPFRDVQAPLQGCDGPSFTPCPISPEPSKIGREIEKTMRMAFSSSSSRTPSRAPSSISRISILQPPSRAPSFTPLPRRSEVLRNTALCRTLPILSLPPSLVISFFPVLHLSSRPPSDTICFFSTSIHRLCFFRSLLLSSRPPSVVVYFFPFSFFLLDLSSKILGVKILGKPILDRVLVISAGVVANIIFAFVIIFVQVVSVGLPILEAFPGVLVPEVRELSAAAHAGVWPGDVILGVNGALLPKSGPAIVSQVVDVIKRNPGRNALLKVGRGNGDLEINITPDENLDRTVINLLPFLGLDSGTLALLPLEAARGGKKIPQEVEQGIMLSRIMVLHNNVSLLANEELEVHSVSAWKENDHSELCNLTFL
ncbi:hypothetical protein ACLOJK_011772 [Asimina triloba]